jgi:energy-coupling factor transporter transmembrane protein EcfT
MRFTPPGGPPDEGPTGFHPAFRVVLLIVLAAMLFRFSLAALGLVLAVLWAAAATLNREALPGIFRALRRIRWLLISIVVIYLWVAPEPAVAGRPWYLPSATDLGIALQRAAILVALVTAVELLRQWTPVREVAAGLVMLLAPLDRLGVDTGVFARRLALTLEAVPLTAERVAAAASVHRIRRGLAGWGEAAAGLVREIEIGAARPPADAALPELRRPALRDWLLLGTGVAACLLAGLL